MGVMLYPSGKWLSSKPSILNVTTLRSITKVRAEWEGFGARASAEWWGPETKQSVGERLSEISERWTSVTHRCWTPLRVLVNNLPFWDYVFRVMWVILIFVRKRHGDGAFIEETDGEVE